MQKFGKFIRLFLIITMLGSLLAGCGRGTGGEEVSNTAGSTNAEEDGKTGEEVPGELPGRRNGRGGIFRGRTLPDFE